jgi:peptide/nickel transport system permease protein
VLLVLACVFARVIVPYNPLDQDLLHVLQGPSSAHWLGTDELGRDILSRLLVGGQVSLLSVAVALAVDFVVGVPLGLIAGYFTSSIGRAVQRTSDLLMSIPGLIVLLAVVAVFSDRIYAPMIALGLLGSASLTRIVASVTLTTRHELFVDAAQVNGVSPLRILVRHVAPRIAVPAAIQGALFCGNAFAQQAGLAFLGFGVLPPAPSWGGMVAEAASLLERSQTFILFAGGIIAITILCLGLVGDALGDALASMSAGPGGRDDRRFRRRARQFEDQDAEQPVVEGDGSLAMESSDAVLAVRDLSVEYGVGISAVRVVQNVSFSVAPGRTIGIVGESGCGKSTVIQALTGVLPGNGRAVGGEVLFRNQRVDNLRRKARAALRGKEIALVSQEPMNSLDPAFTVGSLIGEAVRRHTGVSRRVAKEKVVELLTSVRLQNPEVVAKRRVFELSGGMAQRVGIALALAGDPAVLLADEPTSAVDVTVQQEILKLLRTVQAERHMALVIVTHNWAVVEEICDDVVVMYAGQVVESGAMTQTLQAPRHPYTAGLLAAMPSRGTPRQRLAAIPGSVPPPERWPAGCRFAPRCGLASEECRIQEIPLVGIGRDHLSRCIHIEELALSGQELK